MKLIYLQVIKQSLLYVQHVIYIFYILGITLNGFTSSYHLHFHTVVGMWTSCSVVFSYPAKDSNCYSWLSHTELNFYREIAKKLKNKTLHYNVKIPNINRFYVIQLIYYILSQWSPITFYEGPYPIFIKLSWAEP
jgi:hypothetical protein